MKKLILPSLIFVSFLLACKKDKVTHDVTYKISSTDNMNVSYTDQNGDLKSVSNVSSDWTYTFQTSGDRIVRLIVTSVDGSHVGGAIHLDGQETAQRNGVNEVSMAAPIP
jgi:hypothetical protein